MKSSAARGDWLARALGRAGILRASDAEAAIKAGRVSVNGQVQRQPLATVREADVIHVEGRKVSLATRTRALVFHKPAGAVTSTRDAEGAPTVFDLLEAALPPELASYAWHAIGRLDRDTTGLLLFTNDEGLVEHVTSPKTHLSKRYVATVQGRPTEPAMDRLRKGLELNDGPARAEKARVRGDSEVELVISEGRHHQVKRMLGEVGLPVRALHRAGIGGLELDVPLGGWRELAPEEIRDQLRYEPRNFHGG